jgi:hypothetical protein
MGGPSALWIGRWLRWSVALVWLATGLLVLHPAYRQEGMKQLDRLGLPAEVMYATCLGEIVLGLRVAVGRADTWLTALQVILISGFTAILAFTDPALLVHHLGVLTKNLPLVAVIVTAWLVEREGWTRRAEWWLRIGLALIWLTEGLFPKIVFPSPVERALVTNSGLVAGDPATFLHILGIAEIAAGLCLLVLRGRLLQAALAMQALALVALPLLVAWQDPLLWVHPFGPLTKNVPILAATVVLFLTSQPSGNRIA